MDDQTGKQSDWSSLPTDLLILVLQRLKNTETDCRRLRAVCTTWRSALPPLRAPPLQLPLKLMLPMREDAHTEEASHVKRYGLLRQSIFYLISPPRGSSSAGVWLTRVEETLHSGSSNQWKLENIMSDVCDFKPLPQLKVKVNLLDYSISEVARSYHFSSSYKTVVLPFPKSEDTDDGNFSVLTLTYLTYNSNLLLYNYGVDKWVDFPEVRRLFQDIIAYDGKFYAANYEGKLISIDPVTFEVKQIIKCRTQWELPYNDMNTYLLESCGRLYLVQTVVFADYFFDDASYGIGGDYKYEKPFQLDVFALSSSYSSKGNVSHYWEPVTSLGNRVFFVSSYVSFSLTAQELGWDKGNCIFFTQKPEFEFDDPLFFGWKEDDWGRIRRYYGLYKMEDGRSLIANDLLTSDCSEYTKIFWPVPIWLAAPSNRQHLLSFNSFLVDLVSFK